jgi:DNA-binding transcriptional MerR regulator
MQKKIPQYLSDILKKNPKIKSGRKNYQEQHIRLLKQINLIKKYFKSDKIK